MEMLGAGGFDSKRLRMIGGVVFLLLALTFTFLIPLTIAVEDMDLLVSTGEPNLEPVGDQLDIGWGKTGLGQEFTVPKNSSVEAVKLRVTGSTFATTELVVGIAENLTVKKTEMITYRVTPAFASASEYKIFDLPTADLKPSTTYYLIVMVPKDFVNQSDHIQYWIENTEVNYVGELYVHMWSRFDLDLDPWAVEVPPPNYGALDIWFELYGFWVDEDENGIPDEEEEEPQWIDNQTATIMILWVGSIFAGLGGGMLLTQMPEIEQRPWIALLGGSAIFLGWFFMIANPWMLITMVPAIVRAVMGW